MIEFDTKKMSEDEMVEAANRIFTAHEKDFERIKSEKWYQSLFRAITLNQDGKKYAVRGVTSLAKLQQLFIKIYVKNYRKSHEQLDEVIDVVTKNSKAIKKMFYICVLNVEKQESLESLSAQDAEILALFLGDYRDENDVVPDKVRIYNRSVLRAINQKVPIGTLDNHQIRELKSPKVVYRCFLEQCAIDGTIDSHEWTDKIYEDLKDFELSQNSKNEIEKSVRYEAEVFGIEYFLEKYEKENSGIFDSDFLICNEQKDEHDYIGIEFTEKVEISNECAQIFFDNCYNYDPGKNYIESSNYIIFGEKNNVYKINKKTCKKEVLIENIVEDTVEFFEKGKMTVYADTGYYVIDNDLYYIDLKTLSSGIIFHINERKDKNGQVYEITDLKIYKSKKCFYRNGDTTYLVDFREGASSAIKVEFGSVTRKYTIRGDYAYFIDSQFDNDLEKTGYVLKRYGVDNNQTTAVSELFEKHEILPKSISSITMYDIEAEGIFGKYYFCVLGYQGATCIDRLGFHCFYIDLEQRNLAKAKPFYIWNSGVYQIQQYRDKLIYVNADKGYSLTEHDIISDKKKVIKKGYGSNDKTPFLERLLNGKSSFQRPNKYMQLGKWIWIKENGKVIPEIVSL